MTVYVDTLMRTQPQPGWPYKYSCHLTADTPDELHEFAQQIGMRKDWFQDHSTFPHYDLTRAKRVEAVRAGAVEETRVEAVRRMRG